MFDYIAEFHRYLQQVLKRGYLFLIIRVNCLNCTQNYPSNLYFLSGRVKYLLVFPLKKRKLLGWRGWMIFGWSISETYIYIILNILYRICLSKAIKWWINVINGMSIYDWISLASSLKYPDKMHMVNITDTFNTWIMKTMSCIFRL